MPEECIHGFETGMCDVCYPKAPPPRPARKAAAASRSAAPSKPRAGSPRVQVRGDRRVYHVIGLAELEDIIAAGGIEGEPRWRSEAMAWRRDDLVLVASAAALGPGAVAVGEEIIAEGMVPLTAVQAIGVASEPVRDAVRAALGSAKAPRVLVYPPWYAGA